MIVSGLNHVAHQGDNYESNLDEGDPPSKSKFKLSNQSLKFTHPVQTEFGMVLNNMVMISFKFLDDMEKFKFNNIIDVLLSIKEKGFDRNFASIIGISYLIDESVMGNYSFDFNEDELNEYSFLFYFFDVEQADVLDKDFNLIVEKILSINPENINSIEVKKILYEKELAELKIKYDKKLINENIYKQQIEKYLR